MSRPHVTRLPEICPPCSALTCTCVQRTVLWSLARKAYREAGVTTNGTALTLQKVVNGNSVSPRVYLLSEDFQRYEQFNLVGKEFSFDIDVLDLPCGMNAAMYLVEMDKFGGASKLNSARASHGTGYCDAQFPDRDEEYQ